MILNVYLWKRIFTHILTVLLVFGIIEYMMTGLSEFSYGLEGDYQVVQALWFVLVTSPSRLYELFPLIVLVGCLTGLGSLANSSELTVIRAAGFSIPAITIRVLQPVLVIMIVVGLLGETFIPMAESYGQAYRSTRSHEDTSSGRYGFWHKDGNEFIYFGALTPEGNVEGLRRYIVNSNGRPAGMIFAKRGKFENNQWQLFEVEQDKFHDRSIEQQQYDVMSWNTDVTPELLSTLIVEPGKLSILGLWKYVSYLNAQGIDASKYELAFWEKALRPVMTAALVLVAISFIFGPLREVAMGTRIFAGVLVGLLIKMSENILPSFAMIYDIDPIIIDSLPIVLCGGLGLWLLRRVG
ncbi:LPS export ABC transporter permease LptG [Gynuella sp.]|uniref:LPS export ABC transporter permease LptG n=1 Tax=Gynuella sp. TaxID=2969146 RepID=UPI003D0AF0EA